MTDQCRVSKIPIENQTTAVVLAGTVNCYSANGYGSSASFNYPTGITINPKNDSYLYVVDRGSNQIRCIFIPTGYVSTVMAPTGLYNIWNVAIDYKGELLYVTGLYDVIYKLNLTSLTLDGEAGIWNVQLNIDGCQTDLNSTWPTFYQPYGLAIDNHNNLYVGTISSPPALRFFHHETKTSFTLAGGSFLI